MGGNALKNTVTRRYQADEYHALAKRVVDMLADKYPFKKISVIKAYNNKSSFGDLDVLIEGDYQTENFIGVIQELFGCREIVKNGNCVSFDFRQLQIDLIVTPTNEFHTSQCYFAYNDLGNLLGRIAHSMGMKLGHDGLSYNWRIDTYQFKNVVLMTDWSDILPVLGLSYERYQQGFNDLEDIFEFVVSSPYFDTDIYLLHNRNNASRVRDAKRKTYMEFLDWLEAKGDEWKYLHICPRKDDKKEWLPYLFSAINGFEKIYHEVQHEWDQAVKFKALYNGELVMRVTGLSGKELGLFMQYVKEYFGEETLKKLILAVNPDLIERFVAHMYKRHTGTLDVVEFDATGLDFLK